MSDDSISTWEGCKGVSDSFIKEDMVDGRSVEKEPSMETVQAEYSEFMIQDMVVKP